MSTTDVTSTPLGPRRQWLSPTVTEAVRFWERGRLAYNGLQLLITAIMFVQRWPESRILYTTNLGSYFYYAVVANILYSLAYIPEAILQIPHLRPHARGTRRFILIVGTGFACLLAILALEVQILRDPSND